MTSSASGPLLVIRSYRDSDRNYVLATWLSSARKASNYGPNTAVWARVVLARETFFDLARPVVEKLLAESKLLLCVDAEDEGLILGYCAVWRGKPVWGYVAQPFRGRGIWRELLNQANQRGLLSNPAPGSSSA